MSVSLTPAAARHVNKYLSKRGKGLGVRLGVKTTGCSGLAYKLEYVDDMTPEDIVFEAMGVKILIDPKAWHTSMAPNSTLFERVSMRGSSSTTPTSVTVAAVVSHSGSEVTAPDKFQAPNLAANDFALFQLPQQFAIDLISLEQSWKPCNDMPTLICMPKPMPQRRDCPCNGRFGSMKPTSG